MLMFEVLRTAARRSPGRTARWSRRSRSCSRASVAIFLVARRPPLLAGAALIGVGMGLAYTQSLFLSLGLPHKKSVAAGIHEAFIGMANATLAPLAGLATEGDGSANGALLVRGRARGRRRASSCSRACGGPAACARCALSAGPPGSSLPRVGATSFVRTRKDLEEAERSSSPPTG